jgi:hypothetical protein
MIREKGERPKEKGHRQKKDSQRITLLPDFCPLIVGFRPSRRPPAASSSLPVFFGINNK